MSGVLEAVIRRFSSEPAWSGLHVPQGNTLVVGASAVCRRLLFAAAVTAASDLELSVMFFTHTPFHTLPVSLRGFLPHIRLENLTKLKFVYVSTLEDLLRDVASLHELLRETACPPSLLVLDGLDRFLTGEELGLAGHALALLHDTAAFLTQATPTPCRTLVSYQTGRGAEDPLLPVLDRYLPIRCCVEEEEEEEEEWRLLLSHQRWRMVLRPGGLLDFMPED